MKILGVFFTLFCCVQVYGQSAGYSILTTIEAKADKIDENDKKVVILNRRHLQSYTDEAIVLDSLKKAYAIQEDENDRILNELMNGRFCNGCSRTATQLRNSGVSDVALHFRQNGGTRPPRQDEIDAKKAELQRKLDAIQDQLDKFKTGENRFSQLRDALDKQMNSLKGSSDNLRAEIQTLSDRYKDAVVKEGKNLAATYVNELMHILAKKHYTENRIDIAIVKLNDLANEEIKAIEQSNTKVQNQVEDEKKKLNSEISLIKDRLIQLQAAFKTRVDELNAELRTLDRELSSLKQQLRLTSSAKTDEIKVLETQIQQSESKIATIRSQITSLNTEYEKQRIDGETKVKKLSDDVWNLTVNLSKRQQNAIEQVKTAFGVKKKILNDIKTARSTNLQDVGAQLIARKSAVRTKFMEYARIVDGERVRLINACQKAGASCYGYDTHNMVVMNWNIAEGCIGEIDAHKNSNDPMYGCTEEYSVYKREYNSFMSGISDSDLDALKRKSGKTQFDMILRKIN